MIRAIIITVSVVLAWFGYNLFRAVCDDISEDAEYESYLKSKKEREK
jgi:hypothetical protein